eukprot:3274050-Pyramimonas_sp.AAC.1
MLDTPLSGLDTLKHVVLGRDNHVRDLPRWPGHVKHVVPARDSDVRYPPAWPGSLSSRSRSRHPRT